MRERESREKTKVQITDLVETAINLRHVAVRIRELAEEALEFGPEIEVLSWKTFSDSLERCRTFTQHVLKAVDEVKTKHEIQLPVKPTSIREPDGDNMKAQAAKYKSPDPLKKSEKKGG